MLRRERPKRTPSRSIHESQSQDASPEVPLSSIGGGIVSKGRRRELSGNVSSEDEIALAFQEPCTFSSTISFIPSQQRSSGGCVERQLQSRDQPSILPFHEPHHRLLTLAATVATQSSESQIAVGLLEGILSTFVSVAAAPEDGSTTDLNKEDGYCIGQETRAAGYVPLYTCYPELKVLREVNNVRKTLDSLQTCPSHARITFYYLLEYHIRGLHEVLPDPLFEAFFAVLSRTLKHHTSFLTKSRMRLFEVQLLKTVESIQMELLKQTKMLTERATLITLCFRHTIPYVPKPLQEKRSK